MGGRLDATNVINKPDLAIITGIDLDHTAFLGDTVEKIAAEKAGIIKQGSVALYGGENAAAEAVIQAEATKMQSILCKTDYSRLKINSIGLEGTSFNYKSRSNIDLSLLGSYQPRNAAIVLDAIDILSGVGLKVSEDSVRSGLKKAKWPARFEIIGRDPMVIFDGAHNPQGVDAAVESIKEYFGEKKVVIVSGVLRDKDYQHISRSICKVAREVFTITADNPRALSAESYARTIAENGVPARACDSIESALALAIAEAKEMGEAVCCLGSLYTYSDIIGIVEK